MQDFKLTFERALSRVGSPLSLQTNYLLRIEVRQSTVLRLFAVQLSSGQCWKIIQDKTQIQNLTEMTGIFKKFDVFVKMLLTAIKQESPSVDLELHTYEQLDRIRAELRGQTDYSPAPGPPGSENKRYMILSYASGYDKVQYPLILTLDNNPDRELLSEAINHLKTQIETTRSQPSFNLTGGSRASSASMASQGFFPKVDDSVMSEDFMKARAENELLKSRLKSLRDSKASGFFDVNSQQKEELLSELEETKRNKMSQMGRLSQLIEERQDNLRRTMTELELAQSELSQLSVDDFNIEEARSELGEISHLLEEEMKTNKTKLVQNQRTLDRTYDDLATKRAAEKRIRVKANQLENQLSTVLKRLNIVMKSKGMSPGQRRGGSGSIGAKFRNNSPGNYLQNNRLKTPPMKRPGYSASPGSGMSKGVRSSGYGRNYSPGVRNYSPGYKNSSPSSAVAAYQNRLQTSGSKKKMSSRNASPADSRDGSQKSNKGSPAPNSRLYNPARGNAHRLYSPSGRPRVPPANYGQRGAPNRGKLANANSYSGVGTRQTSNPRQAGGGMSVYDRLSAARSKNPTRVEGAATSKLLNRQNKENSAMNVGVKNLASQQKQVAEPVEPPKEAVPEAKAPETSATSVSQEQIARKLEMIQSLLKRQQES